MVKKYNITTLEKFEVEVHYTVEAGSQEEAIELIRKGEIEYDYSRPTENDELIEILEESSDEN